MIRTEEKTGTLATAAIIAAVLSFILTFTGHVVWGGISALVSIPLGAIGLFMSASPRVGGGLMSIAAIILGVFAIGVAIVGGFLGMLF